MRKCSNLIFRFFFLVRHHGGFMNVRRLVSILCVCCLIFSLFVTPAFAIDSDSVTDSDFVRYACETSLTVGSHDFVFSAPFVTRSSVSSDTQFKDLDFTCAQAFGLYGTFTYVFIVGSTSTSSFIGETVPLNVMTQDDSGSILWADSLIRNTSYSFDYKVGNSTYHCSTYTAIFSCSPGYNFIEAYVNPNTWLGSVKGGSCWASFLLYSPTQSSASSHLSALDEYMELLVHTYIPQTNSYLNNIKNYTAVPYTFLNDFKTRFNSSTSRGSTWDNMPVTPNATFVLADVLHAIINEKASNQASQRPLNDLRDYQDDLVSTAGNGLPSLLSGFRKFFTFFDISESTSFSDLDLEMGLIGYKNYFDNQPPDFFSATTRSNLEVNNG